MFEPFKHYLVVETLIYMMYTYLEFLPDELFIAIYKIVMNLAIRDAVAKALDRRPYNAMVYRMMYDISKDTDDSEDLFDTLCGMLP
jgi:hypothetical protein